MLRADGAHVTFIEAPRTDVILPGFPGGPTAEALDEFDQVAALLGQKPPSKPKTLNHNYPKPENVPKPAPTPTADFALDSDEEEEARTELRGEFLGGSGKQLEATESGGPGSSKSERTEGLGMDVDDEELTLEAAVKPKARKKKKKLKLKIQGDE